MRRIGIIGGGRFGSALASFLADRGADIVLLDRDREIVQRLSGILPRVAQGDATDADVLREAGFAECDVAVVAIGDNMEGSILATMTLKEMKVPQVVAKAVTDLHGKVLERVGANRVVYPEKDMALRLGRMLLTPTLLDYVEVSDGAGIAEIKAPPWLVGKTLSEARIPNVHGVIVLALRRANSDSGRGRTILAPGADERIERGDVLMVFGPDQKLRQIERQTQ